MTIFSPQVRPVSASLISGILDQMSRAVYVSGPEVDGIHGLRIGAHRPLDVFVVADDIRLYLEPGHVKLRPSVFTRANRSFPVPARYPIAARQTDSGQIELPHRVDDIPSEAQVVGGRMFRVVNTAIYIISY